VRAPVLLQQRLRHWHPEERGQHSHQQPATQAAHLGARTPLGVAAPRLTRALPPRAAPLDGGELGTPPPCGCSSPYLLEQGGSPEPLRPAGLRLDAASARPHHATCATTLPARGRHKRLRSPMRPVCAGSGRHHPMMLTVQRLLRPLEPCFCPALTDLASGARARRPSTKSGLPRGHAGAAPPEPTLLQRTEVPCNSPCRSTRGSIA